MQNVGELMQITLDIKHRKDLEILLPLLKRLGISIANKSIPEVVVQRKPLSSFIGVLSQTKSEDFDAYLRQSRSEWDRNIF
ncbi:MAG: hypothetical protein AAGG68_17855 [Bacteroidota bacterium]